ncbi:hypothetical protein C7999DRAFT_35786 [Corynascus novoguineensis]|uniref:Uncharacterized protein n=1 Tax=Corynascus novoguineensis TaxID=1126955 RepID=A0AAN7CMA4_9PEZI|nr:hypothetical protein C7999DRAFT_35786 [Corynascus novoguineensis]
MHTSSLLLTLTALTATTLAVPSAPHPVAVVRRDGPCDASSETCRPVLQANACFAAYITRGTKEEVLRCVNDADFAQAEEDMCACYGCAEQVVQDWAEENLDCAAPA